MIVSPRLRAELIVFADERAPQEAPGLISAPSGTSEGERDVSDLYTLWRAENAAEDPSSSFLIPPAEQAALLGRIWSRSEDVLGIFHSHPRSGPEPSQRDRELAAAIERGRPAGVPALVWVILGRCLACDGDGELCAVCSDAPAFTERCWRCDGDGAELWVGTP